MNILHYFLPIIVLVVSTLSLRAATVSLPPGGGHGDCATLLEQLNEQYHREFLDAQRYSFTMKQRTTSSNEPGEWTTSEVARNRNKVRITNEFMTMYPDEEHLVILIHDTETILLHPATDAAVPGTGFRVVAHAYFGAHTTAVKR